jgi:ribosome-binding factor A
MSIRDEKIAGILQRLGASFLAIENNGSSLITVTEVKLSKDAKYATIFFTVFPESFEKTAIEFAKRKRSEFKKYVRDNSSLGRIPMMDFQIDLGEKNRQKIDSLLNQG